MSKIIKHTFQIPRLFVKDGELVEGKPTEVTYTFTLLFKGLGLYEEITGRTLFSDLVQFSKENIGDTAEEMFESKFIENLAAVSYVKIDGDKFHNNRATAEEFRKLPIFKIIVNDMLFIQKLMEMATECINTKSSKKNKEVTNQKK